MLSHFDAVHAYGAAKLENILFTSELHRRYHAGGLSAASFYPGNVVTNFAVEAASPIIRSVRRVASNPAARRVLFSTPEQGADQLVWLTEGTPGTDWGSGAYYHKRKACKPRNPQAVDATPGARAVGTLTGTGRGAVAIAMTPKHTDRRAPG